MKTLVMTLSLLVSISAFSATLDSDSDRKGGGKKVSLKQWFNKNLSYPEEALKKKEEGTVYVSFQIDQFGKAIHIEIEEGISESLNEEAIQLVKEMPLDDFTSNGFTEGASYVLPVKFVLK